MNRLRALATLVIWVLACWFLGACVQATLGARCGDGLVDTTAGETCDPPDRCPATCEDGKSCTLDTLIGSAEECTAQCQNVPLAGCCQSRDGLCPLQCDSSTDDDCGALCGDYQIERGETCDPPSSCPVSCNDGNPCTIDYAEGAVATCDRRCVLEVETDCLNGDRCCPADCTAASDDDCSVACGDGVVQPGETCDGSCPTSCDDGNACTLDLLTGSAANCSAACSYQILAHCLDGDGCCPTGCAAANDSDCSSACGNLALDPGETCDPADTCPADCDDGNACTLDFQTGSPANCNVACNHQGIAECGAGDGCCPRGCSHDRDSDCSLTCGNGYLESGEECEPPSTCPVCCVDSDACTIDSMTGSAVTCNASCMYQRIVSCRDNDGCCPAGCDLAADNDCQTSCGDGHLDLGEECDPPSACPADCQDADACTLDLLVGDASLCTATCQHQTIEYCWSDDGCCPSGCTWTNDVDCVALGTFALAPALVTYLTPTAVTCAWTYVNKPVPTPACELYRRWPPAYVGPIAQGGTVVVTLPTSNELVLKCGNDEKSAPLLVTTSSLGSHMVADFESGVDPRGQLTGGTLNASGPWYAWEHPPTAVGDDVNFWDLWGPGDYKDYVLSIGPEDWRPWDVLEVKYYTWTDCGPNGVDWTKEIRAINVFVHDADGTGNSDGNGFHNLGRFCSDGNIRLPLLAVTNRDQIDQVRIRIAGADFYGNCLNGALATQRTHLHGIALGSSRRTIADFEQGVDSRAFLSGGLTTSGPEYAWEYPPTSAGDDINYWDVWSNGNPVNDYEDYVLALGVQDWRAFDTLEIRFWTWCDGGCNGHSGFQVYIHDADGTRNSDGNGFHNLGLHAASGVARMSLLNAANRDEIDQLRVRVLESFFGGVGIDGARQRTHLYDVALVSTGNRLDFPVVPNFYSPNVIYENGEYKMWATVADSVRYFTSADGITWNGGNTVLTAMPCSWEDDGGSYDGYTTGISDPRVIKEVTAGWAYTMYYTAGKDPNQTTRLPDCPDPVNSGGMGVAFSNNGIDWVRFAGNPIRSYVPDGHTFVRQAVTIHGNTYVYFLGGGSAAVPPTLRRIEDLGNGTSFGLDQDLSTLGESYPLFFDTAAGTCWLGKTVWATPPFEDKAGPPVTEIYRDSDCVTQLGTRLAAIGPGETGHAANFDFGATSRGPSGERVLPGSDIIFLFASGDCGWHPRSIALPPIP